MTARNEAIPDPATQRMRESLDRSRDEDHRARRERIATAVLAGWVANVGPRLDEASSAEKAVAYADALIAALDG